MKLADLTAGLREALGIVQKRDIQLVSQQLREARGPAFEQAIALGDDCAALPDGEGYLLFAAEGMWPTLVETEPFFAGYSAVLVNVSDVYAMGGRPLAVVDGLFSSGEESARQLLLGMQAGAERLGVPIVGGHTNLHSPYAALVVAILGRARTLITSFDAQPGDVLLCAVDLRGEMHPRHPFWNASGSGSAERLRGDLEVLPTLAESGLCRAGKDISMGGLVGSTLMLLESSGVGGTLWLDAIPRPDHVELMRWLLAFPSYGFVLAVAPSDVPKVRDAFERRSIACAAIGRVDRGDRLQLALGDQQTTLFDLAREPLTGFAARRSRFDA